MFFVFKLFHLVFLLQQFPLALVLAKRDQDSKNTKTLNRQDKFNECKCKPYTAGRKFKSCQKAIMVIAGRAHCFFLFSNISELYFFQQNNRKLEICSYYSLKLKITACVKVIKKRKLIIIDWSHTQLNWMAKKFLLRAILSSGIYN